MEAGDIQTIPSWRRKGEQFSDSDLMAYLNETWQPSATEEAHRYFAANDITGLRGLFDRLSAVMGDNQAARFIVEQYNVINPETPVSIAFALPRALSYQVSKHEPENIIREQGVQSLRTVLQTAIARVTGVFAEAK